MKIRIALVALIPVAAAIGIPPSVRAGRTASSQQSPAPSSNEPAQSVWDGVYTAEQANRGAALYAPRCAHCHGPDLGGGEIAPALNSGEFKSNWTGLFVDDLFERIKVSMPMDNPGSLSRQQTADVVAFVLSRNGFPEGKTELAREAEVLKTIRFEGDKPEITGAGETSKPLETVRTTSAVAALSGYHVIKRIPIPGDTGWDYITADSEGRRLYVPHGIEVVVLDLDSWAIVGKITGLKGVHGVAIAREFGRGFISATDPGSVTIFDLKTLAVIDKMKVGDDPNGIIYDPGTQRVFTADRGSKRVTAIDAKTGKIAGAIDDLGGKTEHLAADEAGHVFLNMQDVGKLHKLDSKSLKVLETWPLDPPCGLPSSMGIDRAHNRIFIGCRSGLFAVVDGATGKLVATQPIGLVVDALEYDPKTALIYVSTGGGDGALSIFHQESPDTYTLVENVKTLPGARTLAFDNKSGRIYLPVADFGPLPVATAETPRPRAPTIPGTFSILVVGK
ncbi:MAG TPA: c-type cytochrome [Candidatus Acidoferrales bacterium]|nr:c-type cytochrome [Candidatus Acidoferrales bacterium]